MKFLQVFIILLSIGIIQSCDYYQKQIGENYFIRAVNSPETMDIGFGEKDGSEGLIEQTVFEVHWDKEYILAKRHPLEAPGNEGINREVTEYFIIKKVKFGEAKASENMFGPLTKIEFGQMKKELGLEEQEMDSITFDDLK